LNYRPTTNPPPYNPDNYNLVIVWDILMQNYRVVSADQVDVLREMPANEEFWQTFNNEIYPMSTEQKINFMNS
jgi:hypothetical protein